MIHRMTGNGKYWKLLSNGGPSGRWRVFCVTFGEKIRDSQTILVLQEQLAEKDILIDALKEESRCLGVVDLILPLVKDERSKERPNPRESKADTKPRTRITC